MLCASGRVGNSSYQALGDKGGSGLNTTLGTEAPFEDIIICFKTQGLEEYGSLWAVCQIAGFGA